MKQKIKQSFSSKELTAIKPKRISKIKDARRLLANLIYLFQKGDINSEYLKTLCYALIKYSELYKTETLENIEERILQLEEWIKEMINTNKYKNRIENLEFNKLEADDLIEKDKARKSVMNAVMKEMIFGELNEKDKECLKTMKNNPDEYKVANILHNI